MIHRADCSFQRIGHVHGYIRACTCAILQRMINVLVIVPYEALLEEYRKAIKAVSVPGIQFTTSFIVGTAARSIETVKDYDIVVARGMTGRAIAKIYPELNLIDIRMDTSDIASAMLEVIRKYGHECKVALVLPNSSICPVPLVAELTSLEIGLQEVDDEKELDSVIEQLRGEGYDVFVGGLTVNQLCEAKGYHHVHIKTGLPAIAKSISDAVLAAQILDRERTRLGLLKSLVDNNPDSLLVLDERGVITAANQAAKLFFKKSDIVGLSADSLFPHAIMRLSENMEIVSVVDGQLMLITEHQFTAEGEKKGTFVSLRKVDDICSTEKKIRSKLSEKGLVAKYSFSNIIANQVKMKELIAKAIRYAGVDGNVLITGETGTGKELFVQSMHNASSRRDKPFVAVNCAALSEQLLESELFGYADGAFTGASKGGKIGLFELAQGGTLFLDEIGELPIKLQAKILRALQEKEIRRIGGDEYVPIDVRIMSATNQNIGKLVDDGLFRRDLFYRINLLTIVIPPLRDRKEDIPVLFSHFVEEKSKALNRGPIRIEPEAVSLIKTYDWPGNIRELRNVAERLVILNSNHIIDEKSVMDVDFPVALDSETKDENTLLHERYLASGLSLMDFSASIGISRTTLWRRFKALKKPGSSI